MKYILIILSCVLLNACNGPKQNDYASFSGKILNKNSDSITVSSKNYSKTISVKEDGTFSDTLSVKPRMYSFYDGGEYTSLFLKNGFNLTMALNTEQFDESIQYEGIGAEENNFLAEKSLLEEKLFDINIDDYTSETLKDKFDEIEAKLNNFIASKPTLDTIVLNTAKKSIVSNIEGNQNYLSELIKLRENLPKGTISPVFENYENHAGGTTNLTDLRGKYVYIDVWATWCGPCKAEIPFLKEIEKEYHENNITFVSISIDRQKDHEKWVKMVNEKELGGIQLFADNDWKSKFITDYYIKGIPRFIFIDPEGKVISPDAPRPSKVELKEMFNELL